MKPNRHQEKTLTGGLLMSGAAKKKIFYKQLEEKRALKDSFNKVS